LAIASCVPTAFRATDPQLFTTAVVAAPDDERLAGGAKWPRIERDIIPIFLTSAEERDARREHADETRDGAHEARAHQRSSTFPSMHTGTGSKPGLYSTNPHDPLRAPEIPLPMEQRKISLASKKGQPGRQTISSASGSGLPCSLMPRHRPRYPAGSVGMNLQDVSSSETHIRTHTLTGATASSRSRVRQWGESTEQSASDSHRL